MMNKKMDINGFINDEVFILYKFVEIYERLKFGYFKTETEMLERYPQMNNIKDKIKKYKFEEKEIEEIKAINIDSIKNEFYFTRHISLTLGFLYHLRNSICHAKIIKEANYVKLFDYSAGGNPQCNAKGYFKYEIIVELTSELNKVS